MLLRLVATTSLLSFYAGSSYSLEYKPVFWLTLLQITAVAEHKYSRGA